MVPPGRHESRGRLPPRVACQIQATARLPKSIAEDCVAAFEGSVARVDVLQTFWSEFGKRQHRRNNMPHNGLLGRTSLASPSTLPEVTFNERREEELSVINAAHCRGHSGLDKVIAPHVTCSTWRSRTAYLPRPRSGIVCRRVHK